MSRKKPPSPPQDVQFQPLGALIPLPHHLFPAILHPLAPPGGCKAHRSAAQPVTQAASDVSPGKVPPGTPASSRAQEPQKRSPEGWHPP